MSDKTLNKLINIMNKLIDDEKEHHKHKEHRYKEHHKHKEHHKEHHKHKEHRHKDEKEHKEYRHKDEKEHKEHRHKEHRHKEHRHKDEKVHKEHRHKDEKEHHHKEHKKDKNEDNFIYKNKINENNKRPEEHHHEIDKQGENNIFGFNPNPERNEDQFKKKDVDEFTNHNEEIYNEEITPKIMNFKGINHFGEFNEKKIGEEIDFVIGKKKYYMH